MQITLNGKKKELTQEKITLTQLLDLEQVETPDMISVQINGEFVDREKFQTTPISTDDEVDFLYFMGGGA